MDLCSLPAALRYQRTEYAKKVRKDYESGKLKERRCNMREYTVRTDGICNTLTTVQKDNYIVVGAAMRGRYNSEGKTEQQLELREDELFKAITTVQKDFLYPYGANRINKLAERINKSGL